MIERTFNKPDLNAPRFRRTSKNILTKELFNAFKEKYPKYNNLDEKVFRDIIKTFNGLIWQTTIENRDGVELPESLGFLLITKYHTNKKENIDYANSFKYNKKIIHRNWASDNFTAKICYSNYSLKYRFADRELWSFSPVRQYSRTVSANFAELYNKYIILTDNIRLNTLYKKK